MVSVGIFLFDDVEVLDFAGPFEVFSVTSELNNYKLLKVFTVSRDGNLIKSVNSLKIQPDYSFANHPEINILVVPGGIGTKSEMKKTEILEWIRKVSLGTQIIFSVCSGARILGALGMLDGLESITHHEVIPHLKEIAPKTIVREGVRFVDNGNIMTSGGISAGIDLSLHVVEKLFGAEVRSKTAEYMEYGI